MQENNHRLLQWLITRGISRAVIESFNLSVVDHNLMGECIQIPINDTGLAKYRRDPDQDVTPKYIADRGLKANLFGVDKIEDAKHVLITEGELDALVAWSHNIPAVTSTAGARTFQPEWVEHLEGKHVTICFDNDEVGAESTVKVLKLIPWAKVVLIPERPNIKDITDYVKHGGDLHELMKTATRYVDIDAVKEERSKRIAVYESVKFHNAFINEFTPKVLPNSRRGATNQPDTKLERAKRHPIPNLIEFTRRKACCIWHSEKTPSMHYYPKTNSVYCFGCGKHGDAVDVYRQLHDCDFKTAIHELGKA